MYILFDCNNFFASCEQVLRPVWRARPLIVLSNNDGCIISRSAEAKAAGFLMGEPYFKCRARIEQHHAIVCSSNFRLYGDFSDRVIGILEQSLPTIEQYSIDEAFAHVDDERYTDWEQESRSLRQRIRRWTGITTSVGIAPTKTLAKLANEQAKKNPDHRGVYALRQAEDWEALLSRTPVSDIWGVGKKLAPRLRALGIQNAQDLASTSLDLLRRQFGVTGERLALELSGKSCIGDEPKSTRGQIMVSRSLKEGIDDWEQLRGVLCEFVEKAARNLRREGLLARDVQVVLRTSPFEQQAQQYSSSLAVTLPHPSDDTRAHTAAATALLERVYRPGFAYKKIGVILCGLMAKESFHPTFDHPQPATSPLMETLDELQRAGHKVHFANHATEQLWHRSFSSPAYTTSWDSLPEAF